MKKYTIGIDLGGTNTKIALVGDSCDIIKREQFSTKLYKTKEDLVFAISGVIKKMISGYSLKESQISGIGIGAPGLVDSDRGIVHCLTNIPGWENVNLKNLLQRKIHFETYIDNDVNLMALAESKFGAAKGAKEVFCVTLGTGVGGGIVIDGKIYRGYTQSAGEIGHVSINSNGPKCNCGNKGCIESYIGNNAIVENVVARIKSGTPSILKELTGGQLDKITPHMITQAAKKGDKLSIQIWAIVAEYLSVGLVMVVNVFNPQIIVIGGGIAEAGKFLFDPLRKKVRENAIAVSSKAVHIVKAKLGNDAGIIGAAELVRMQKTRKVL